MPWKVTGPDKYEFSGDITYWLSEIFKAHAEEQKRYPFMAKVLQHDYLKVVAIALAKRAIPYLNDKWFGKPKAAKVQAYYDMGVEVPVFDLLDYLAIHAGVDFRRDNFGPTRNEVREVIRNNPPE